MFKHPHLRWLSFYMLVPLAAVLLFLDEAIPMPPAWRQITLLGIAILIGGLAVNWIERRAGFIESQRLGTHTYRVVSYPWSVFQSTSSTIEDAGASEDESIRYDETPIRHVRSTSGD